MGGIHVPKCNQNSQKNKLVMDKIVVQFSSGTQSCPTLCDPMDCRMPGFPVLHYLPEFAHTHFHWVNDAIQPSHPLLSTSPLAFNLSQHQGLFKWVSSSYQWPKYWSFSFSINPSNEYPGLISFRTFQSRPRNESSRSRGTVQTVQTLDLQETFFSESLFYPPGCNADTSSL